MTPLRRLCLLSLGATTFALPLAADTRPADPLANLRPGHPRLLVSTDRWVALHENARGSPDLQALISRFQNEADALLTVPVLERKLNGRRLLRVSRTALHRILRLALAYRLSGDDAYLHRAEAELDAVTAFSDWNPDHFLDVAETTTAVAIGYDWLHADLAPATRDAARRAIIDLGIRPALDPDAAFNWWYDRENNWNQVCFSGLTLGALAVADDEPEIARDMLRLARSRIHHGLVPYAPHGLYPEGPAYWDYGTSFQILMIDALRSALGTDWDLPAAAGFLPSATAQAQLTGPTGLAFNFSDGREGTSFSPALLWFARETGQPALLDPFRVILHQFAQGGPAIPNERLDPLAVLWWAPNSSAASTAPLPLTWSAGGEQPVVAMRSAWNDPNAAYLAAKGGSASLNHAHMDAGSFIYEADGVRWVRDLGAQDYNSLESKGIDLWNRSQDSDRWRVFRLNNRSHNTLVIDNQLQQVDGHATLREHGSNAEGSFAVYDLSSVYAGQATRVQRSFHFSPRGRTLIRDELAGLSPGADVRWALVTAADVELHGAEAVLRDNTRHLTLRALAPVNATFEVIPAAPVTSDDFNAPNPDRRLVVLHLPAPASGELSIETLLVPGSVTDITRPADQR